MLAEAASACHLPVAQGAACQRRIWSTKITETARAQIQMKATECTNPIRYYSYRPVADNSCSLYLLQRLEPSFEVLVGLPRHLEPALGPRAPLVYRLGFVNLHRVARQPLPLPLLGVRMLCCLAGALNLQQWRQTEVSLVKKTREHGQ